MITISHTVLYSSVTNASQQVTLVDGERYLIASDIACWIKQGANPTAVAAEEGTMYLPANFPVVISAGADNTKLAVLRAGGADGNLTAARLL